MARNEAKTASAAAADLSTYFRSIGEEGLLTADDERQLAEAIARGQEAARSRLIKSNLRLVVTIARDFRGRGLEMDDLIGEGNLGLIKAAEKYDPAFGVRFSTYASYWIKQAMRQALGETTPTIRLPNHLMQTAAAWHRASVELARELDREPWFHEVADRMGLSPAQRTMMAQGFAARSTQLESAMEADEVRSLADAPGREEAPEAHAELADELAELRRWIAALDDRERAVLEDRYGLGDGTQHTLKEIGDRLGVTREWARKLELRAVRKLAEMAPACRRTAAAPERRPEFHRRRLMS